MLIKLQAHLRSNVVAYLALFVALGGTSYAAFRLPTNSVGTRQIRNHAVTAAKVKVGSLLARDFRSGQLPTGQRGVQGNSGQQGPQGSPGGLGSQGPKGAAGANGATNVVVRDGTPGASQAVCHPGERATGGGAEANGSLTTSEPAYSTDGGLTYGSVPEGGIPTAWVAQTSGSAVDVFVICAAP